MLPKDPNMLVSVVNTKLRDMYRDLSELCDREDEDYNEILSILTAAGYKYNDKNNQFSSYVI